jgi:hypothetical protein
MLKEPKVFSLFFISLGGNKAGADPRIGGGRVWFIQIKAYIGVEISE